MPLEPAGCVQPSRSSQGSARHRLAHSHGDGLRRPHYFSLVPTRRRGKPILWTGFPLGVFSEKASLLSQGKAPLRPAFPSAGRFAPRPHPFSPKLSRFGAGSFVAHKPRQPRVLTIKWGVGALTPEPSPTKTRARSGPATRGGKPRLPVQPHAGRARTLPMVFSGPGSSVPANSRFLVGAPSTAPPAEILPLLRHRRSGSPAGQGMLGRRTAPHFGDTASRYAASPGQLSNPWKNPSRIFQCLEKFLPTSGKTVSDFSNVWKLCPKIFQPSERNLRFFPSLGTPSRNSSNLRMKSFRTPESPRCGEGVPGPEPRRAGRKCFSYFRKEAKRQRAGVGSCL